jgi:predicted DNA-binding ribbon-helix-helix protein
MSTTSRQSVTLTAPQIAYLRAEAERLGLTVSDLIRRIVDQHREARGA